MIQTWSWPAVLPTAVSGTVRRCVASAKCTLASAYWPARSRSPGFASSIVTPIDRVPASAAGAMRASLPATFSATPSTET